MPVFALNDKCTFPPVELAEENGILAVGGDLSTRRLLEAYSSGIFPWYSDDDPIIWWSPDPRFVICPEDVKISKSMRQVLRRKYFSITFDTAFSRVIQECSLPRDGQDGTWITDEMTEAYCRLHDKGYAHSVEAWQDGKLAGGLYGVSLGDLFFGESMFTRVSNASKAAFITLCKVLEDLNFRLIDCQVYTEHLHSLGASYIPRFEFINIINEGLEKKTVRGNWNENPAFNLTDQN